MLDAKQKSPDARSAEALGNAEKHRGHRQKPTHSLYGDLQPDATPACEAEAAFLADALLGVSDRLRRLSPSHRDPHAFHEAKSELENQLRSLSKAVRQIGGGQ